MPKRKLNKKRKRAIQTEKSLKRRRTAALPISPETALALRVASRLKSGSSAPTSPGKANAAPKRRVKKKAPISHNGDAHKRIIERLPSYSMIQLLRLWQNAVRYSAAKRTASPIGIAASKVVVAVESEWTRRGFQEHEIDQAFAWPTTDAPHKKGATSVNFDAVGSGMLSYLEYRVGNTDGQPLPVRRAILDRVFSGKLPPVFPNVYMEQWGKPQSAGRLQKMAEAIAAFARNLKRRDDDRMQQAIDEWESDLEYLYETYYVGHFGFAWPITRVN